MELLTKEERDEVYDTGDFKTAGEERIAYCQAQLDKDIASNQQAYEIGVSDGKVEGIAEGMKEERERILNYLEQEGNPVQYKGSKATAWIITDNILQALRGLEGM